MKDNEVVVVCTGSQGEPNSALQRMASGDHAHIKLKEQDTVVLSSTPIPYTGNDSSVRKMVDDMFKKNVHIFRHESRDVDNCGPLHVSGHASRDEYGEMMDMIKPKFFLPIYGDYTAKKYHIELAIEHGIPRRNCLNIGNGEVVYFTKDTMEVGEKVPHGTVLVDQTGAIVSSVVIKDRLMLSNEGLVAIVLTIDKKTGQLMTSPDIISRGFIYMKDEEELMNNFRVELKRAVIQRFKRVDLDRFKLELKEHITHFLYDQTGRSPIVIPVVNVIGQRKAAPPKNGQPAQPQKTPQQEAEEVQKRYAEMRSRLLNQDARID
jgi:ribonuclease J